MHQEINGGDKGTRDIYTAIEHDQLPMGERSEKQIYAFELTDILQQKYVKGHCENSSAIMAR
jgi:hypothetical protein